jgi:hypothetical protein
LFVVVAQQIALHLDAGARIEPKPVRVWQGSARAEVEISNEHVAEGPHYLSVRTGDPEHLRALARAFDDLAHQFEAQLAEGQAAAVAR